MCNLIQEYFNISLINFSSHCKMSVALRKKIPLKNDLIQGEENLVYDKLKSLMINWTIQIFEFFCFSKLSRSFQNFDKIISCFFLNFIIFTIFIKYLESIVYEVLESCLFSNDPRMFIITLSNFLYFKFCNLNTFIY